MHLIDISYIVCSYLMAQTKECHAVTERLGVLKLYSHVLTSSKKALILFRLQSGFLFPFMAKPEEN